MFTRPALLVALVMFAACPLPAASAADPTDNPVATFYSGPEGYPAWTDNIRWSRVINMKTYAKGKTDYDKFIRACDELSGGGVLYYPAGAYDFSTMPPGVGLMLPPGVVIRGEAPAGHPDAARGKLELGTKFVFNFRTRPGGKVPADWNFIGLQLNEKKNIRASNLVGIAWVHLTGATIAFGPQMEWGKSWGEAGSLLSNDIKRAWAGRDPSGTHPADALAGGGKKYLGAGQGRLVFGCVLEDAAVLDDFTDPGYGPNGFYTSNHCARVIAYGSRVLVANNLLPKSRKSFLYRQTTEKKAEMVRFDYGKTCGIDINKELLTHASANGTCPGYFEEGVVVRDNFVFNHGQRGFNVSGKWVTITGNVNDREFLRADTSSVLTLDGYHIVKPTSDTKSHAFDLAGRGLWVDSNRFTNVGSSPGLPGSGIIATPDGTPIFSWALTHNTGIRGAGTPTNIGGRDVDCRGLLIGWNSTGGSVGCAIANAEPALTDCAFVGNKCDRTLPDARAIARLKLTPPLTTAGAAPPTAPTGLKAEVYQKDAVRLTWTGGKDAVGYRVERQIGDGQWRVIAYRPPRLQGDAENPAEWVDFTAPSGKAVAYRVVALDAEDSGKAVSEPTKPVTIE